VRKAIVLDPFQIGYLRALKRSYGFLLGLAVFVLVFLIGAVQILQPIISWVENADLVIRHLAAFAVDNWQFMLTELIIAPTMVAFALVKE